MLWFILGLMVVLLLAAFVIVIRAYRRSTSPSPTTYLKLLSGTPAQAAQGFMGLVLGGFIPFCYISNWADRFDEQLNKTRFNDILNNPYIMALASESAALLPEE